MEGSYGNTGISETKTESSEVINRNELLQKTMEDTVISRAQEKEFSLKQWMKYWQLREQ